MIISKLLISLILVAKLSSVLPNVANQCDDKNTHKEWQIIKRQCQLEIELLISQKNMDAIGEHSFRFSKIAYLYKEYIFAENLLYVLKKDYSLYLLKPENNFHWSYLLGRIKLRMLLFKDAILNFQEALQVAEEMDSGLKNKLISYSLNSLGLTYTKIGQYEKALLSYRKSLSYKEKYDNPVSIAKTLNNIANVYGLLEDHENALRYYLTAKDKFLLAKHSIKIQKSLSHCYGNIGITYNKLDKYELSIEAFKTALKLHIKDNHSHDRINIYTYLANSYHKIKNDELAIKYYQLAIDEDAYYKRDNAFLRYELASYYFSNNEYKKSLFYLKKGMKFAQINDNQVLPKLYFLQSQIYTQQRDFVKAMESLLKFNSLREKLLESKFDQDIRNISYQIEIDKNQFDVKLLKKENLLKASKINQQYWIIFSMILMALISWMNLKKTLQQKSKEKKELIDKILAHKQKIMKMEGSKNQLKELFKETSDAILCIDSGWVIAFHNRKFNDICRTSLVEIDNEKIEIALPSLFEIISQLPMDENDMPQSCVIKQLPNDIKYSIPKANIRVNTIYLLDDYTIFSIAESTSSPYKNNKIFNKKQGAIDLILNNISKHQQINDQAIEIFKSELNKNIYSEILYSNVDKKYRDTLVELMTECVNVWSNHTNTNRIELAESSGYWKVSIDDGRLRTRAMDRYLHTMQLPKNPRWRLVVKTAHYILSECDLNSIQRNRLNSVLDDFLVIINGIS